MQPPEVVNTERMIIMKKLLELLKKELNSNWRSELDALGTTFGLREVQTGKSTYYAMTCDIFELYVTREKVLRDEYIRVDYTVFEDFEEKKIKVSTKLFDRFVTALENYAKETEKDRMFNHYRRDIEQMIDREVSKRMKGMRHKQKDQRPSGDMAEH